MSLRSEHPLFRGAALLVALGVFALAILVASPDLHARLHQAAGQTEQAGTVGDADHICAVTLFATGLVTLLVFYLLLLGALVVRGILGWAADEIVAAHPRYRLVPSHAPPAA